MSYLNESFQQKQLFRSPTELSLLMNNSFSNSALTPNSPNSTVSSSNTQKNANTFSSNLCTVLNDPRKDRNKINYLFTKTWGSDFVDTVTIYPISNYKNFKLKDFQDYINDIKEVYINY
jgi:hypothetical protein